MARKSSSTELVFNYANHSTRLGRKIKKIFETQVDVLQAELADPNITSRRRGEILLTLSEILMLLDRSIESGSKLLIKPRQGDGTPEPEPIDSAAVLNEILKGKGRS
jgi:hypothetical protein